MKAESARHTVLDLFSGGGGMSFGFHAHENFAVVGAVDAQNGKPSSGPGTLECNKTYAANMGFEPLSKDIGKLRKDELMAYLGERGCEKVSVLISCAPCTGFSRTIRRNLVQDDPRNGLVAKSAKFVEWLQPDVFLMENVGELLVGKFKHHFENLAKKLDKLGYSTVSEVHSLDRFGLPQTRRRALVVAVKRPLTPRTLSDLWKGYSVAKKATTVRAAISEFPAIDGGVPNLVDPCHVAPDCSGESLERLRLMPHDGASWPDLLRVPDGKRYLIPSMLRYANVGKVGPHRDVYGRLFWDQPSVTIKRECSHTGNGRYAHPHQHRLCTVRELACLQGFPKHYKFVANSLSNMYRHIGDAVPPLISYQLACLSDWILTGTKPDIKEIILPDTHLTAKDIVRFKTPPKQLALFKAA